MEDIPIGSARWGDPPVIMYDHPNNESALLVFRTPNKDHRYEVTSIHRKQIKGWTKDGKVMVQRNKYYDTSRAIKI